MKLYRFIQNGKEYYVIPTLEESIKLPVNGSTVREIALIPVNEDGEFRSYILEAQNDYVTISLEDGSVLVGSINAPLIKGVQPNDLDQDGLYEDVDGSGEFNFGDIIFFFQHFDKDEIANYPEFYDYNGDGQVNFGDVIGLFMML